MKVLATLRMVCHGPVRVDTLVLRAPAGFAEIPIDGQHVRVPYPLVKAAIEAGWAPCDAHEVWPPRKGSMSPPEPLKPGVVIQLPDGSAIEVTAPTNQCFEFPERFVDYFKKLGWVSLAQFA